MEKIYSKALGKIRQNKKKLEKELNIKISFENECVCAEGESIDEYKAVQVIEAINLGFRLGEALILKDDDFILEKINIKDISKGNLARVRARVIGSRGKTKELIENLSDCCISIKDNRIGIIGRAEDIKKTIHALESLVQGAKQGNVYAFLEKQRAREKLSVTEDLGLRYKPRKK